MAQKDRTHRNMGSGNDSFDGRDLLGGRPDGAGARPLAAPTKSAPTPPPPTSPQHDPQADIVREIVETVRSLVARLDSRSSIGFLYSRATNPEIT